MFQAGTEVGQAPWPPGGLLTRSLLAALSGTGAAGHRVGMDACVAQPWLPDATSLLGVHAGPLGAVEGVSEGSQVLQ